MTLNIGTSSAAPGGRRLTRLGGVAGVGVTEERPEGAVGGKVKACGPLYTGLYPWLPLLEAYEYEGYPETVAKWPLLDMGDMPGEGEWPCEEIEVSVEMDAIEALVLLVERIWGLELTRRAREEELDMALAGRLCDCGAARTVLWLLVLTLEVGRAER